MLGNIETVNKSDIWTFKFLFSNSKLPCVITFFSYFMHARILDDTLQILYDNKMYVTDSL